ncbi:MAG: peptide chain release factor N(5)-glutamine methyltransferase [Clostridiales bacterium]|nr:peptide chain release factor N(5)-glutamine methyltransferase [Clostridiales bacterium]
MMRLDRLFSEQKQRLLQDGQDDAEAALSILCEEYLHVTRAQRLTHPEMEVEEAQICAAVDRMLSGEPLAYILGSTEFMGLTFQCTPGVLIPRPETELLVEWALQDQGTHTVRFLDIGTGTGCIALSLAKYADRWTGIGVDLSDSALQLAKHNADVLGVKSVELRSSDLCAAVEGECFDLIISNPPYITAADMEQLDPRVRREPELALYGGPDGLDVYRRIAVETPKVLKNGGTLYLEIGYDQGKSVPQILKDAGFSQIEVRKDLAGLDRCVKGYYYV